MSTSFPQENPYHLKEIWQYPSVFRQRFGHVDVIPNQLLPADRCFAVSNGHPVSHDKLDQGWLNSFHQLLSEPRLAELILTYDNKRILSTLRIKKGLFCLLQPIRQDH